MTIEALKTHRTKQAAERLLKGPRWVDEGWVFAHSGRNYGKDGPAGGVLQPDSVWRTFKGLVTSANVELDDDKQLPPMTLHGLRHTWATLAKQAGVHVRVVQERLGHTTAQITLNIYSHVLANMQQDAAAVVAQRIFGAKTDESA